MDLKQKIEYVKANVNVKGMLIATTILTPSLLFAADETSAAGSTALSAASFSTITDQLKQYVTPANALLVGGVSVGVCFFPALVRNGGARLVSNAWKAITRGKVRF